MSRTTRRGVWVAVTDPITAKAFLTPHLRQLKEAGANPVLVAAPSPLLQSVGAAVGVPTISLPLCRQPSPLQDVRALAVGIAALLKHRPQALHVGTPKAALVLGVAAWITRVPVRLYTVHGLRFETARGPLRWLLMALEFVSVRSATTVVAVSHSVREALGEARILSAERVRVLGAGSISGIDLAEFPNPGAARVQARETFALSKEDKVVLFVGRLTPDKGLQELAESWSLISSNVPNAQLWVVGPRDDETVLTRDLLIRINSLPRVQILGERHDVAALMAAADVLLHPSRREGMGTVILEAAAAEVCAVAFDVTGCRDAVVDGETGYIVPFPDVSALSERATSLLTDDALASRMGQAARARVAKCFRQKDVVARFTKELLS